MIEFSHVCYTYPGAAKPALDNVSLSIAAGDFALLVGPSGAGKSTLLRCINGLTPHFSGGRLLGGLQVAGLDPVVATPEGMSRHVGFVFQDPEAQFVMDRVEDELAFALENAAMPPQEMRVRVEETLDLLDLTPLRDRPLVALSGGEKQRVAIAAALALRPEILVLDEPTSQLDPKSAEDVLNALVRLNADLGLTIVLAEHRMERVLPYIDTLLYLPEQGDVLVGDPRYVLGEIRLGPPLVQLGKAFHWSPLPLTIKEGLRFSRRETAHQAVGEQVAAPDIPDRAPILATSGVEVAYGRQTVVRGVDFAVAPGEMVALMGRNGSGKTSLLKSIVGLVRPVRGKVFLTDEEITNAAVADICRRIGYLPQDPNSLLFAETVMDELTITLRNHGLHPEQGGRPPIDPHLLLAKLGLADKASAYPRDLSVGERQRVALAAIMVTKPDVLLLDEPTRGLDYAAKDALADLLRGWRAEGLAIVVVTHDVELAALLADRVVLMSQGEIIANGAPAEVMGASPLFAPQVARLYPGSGWMTVEDVLQEKDEISTRR
jgi:energy-coupling factor transport system ATP-binding protein